MPAEPSPRVTAEEEAERNRASERAALREEWRIRFAHVGGMDAPDERIDELLGFKAVRP